MGFLKSVARPGAVGGTARWAAKMYRYCASQMPDVELDRVGGTMIMARYGRAMAKRPESTKARTGSALTDLGQRGRIEGIAHLVVLILVAEASFADNAVTTQCEFIETILEELRRRDVPVEYALGSAWTAGENVDALSLWTAWQSSVGNLQEALR